MEEDINKDGEPIVDNKDMKTKQSGDQPSKLQSDEKSLLGQTMGLKKLSGYKTPLKSNNRYIWTCCCLSSKWAIFGTSKGAVYFYDLTSLISHSHKLSADDHFMNNINPEKVLSPMYLLSSDQAGTNRKEINRIAISPDMAYLAFSDSSFQITICKITMQSFIVKEAKVVMKLNHHESRVTVLKWDNDSKRIFSGDDIGNVYEKTISIGLFSSKVQSGLRVLQEQDKSGIIQLNLFQQYLLISSTARSVVLNINPNEKTIKTIGTKKRDGIYGSCFAPLKIGKKAKVRTLSARPKRRIWISELNKSEVKGTMKFNKLPDVDIDFSRVLALGELYLISYDTSQLVIIDLKKVTVAAVETDIEPIIDLDIVHRGNEKTWVAILIHSRSSDISVLTVPGEPFDIQKEVKKDTKVEQELQQDHQTSAPSTEEQELKSPDSITTESIEKAKVVTDRLKKMLPSFKKSNPPKMMLETDHIPEQSNAPYSPTLSTTSTGASTDDGSKVQSSTPSSSFKASMFTADDFEDAEEIVHKPDPNAKKKRKSLLDDGTWDTIKKKKKDRSKKKRSGKKRRKHRRTVSDIAIEPDTHVDIIQSQSDAVLTDLNPSTPSETSGPSDSKTPPTSSAGEKFEDSEPSLKDVDDSNPSSFFRLDPPDHGQEEHQEKNIIPEKVEHSDQGAAPEYEDDPAFLELDRQRPVIVDKWREFMIDENPEELFVRLEKWMFEVITLMESQVFQKGFKRLLPDSQEEYTSLITFWFKYFIISPLTYSFESNLDRQWPESLHQNELFSLCAPYLELEDLVLFANEKENKYVVAMLLTLCESENFSLFYEVFSLPTSELFTRLSKELSQHPSLTLWMFPNLVLKDLERAHTFLIQVYPIIHEKNIENHILGSEMIENLGKQLCQSFYLTYLIRLFKTNLECSMNLSFMNKLGSKLVEAISSFDPTEAQVEGLPTYNLRYLESVFRELIQLAAQDDIQLNLTLIEKKCIELNYDIGLLGLYEHVGKIEDIFKLLIQRKNWKGLSAFMESKRHIRSNWVELFNQVQTTKHFDSDQIVRLMLKLLNADETLSIIESLDDDIIDTLSTNTFKLVCELANYESQQFAKKNAMLKTVHGHILKHEANVLTPEVEAFIPSNQESSEKLDHLLHTLKIVQKDPEGEYKLNFDPLQQPIPRYNESSSCHWGINIDPSKTLCVICQAPLNTQIGSDVCLMQDGSGYHTRCMSGTQIIKQFEGLMKDDIMVSK